MPEALIRVEGLTKVLATLDEYKIRATFFLNGEFMARNPGAVREISASGAEAGSLFFANFDLTDEIGRAHV